MAGCYLGVSPVQVSEALSQQEMDGSTTELNPAMEHSEVMETLSQVVLLVAEVFRQDCLASNPLLEQCDTKKLPKSLAGKPRLEQCDMN